MSRSPIVLSPGASMPGTTVPATSGPRTLSCAFGANCACVFAPKPVAADAALASTDVVDVEVAKLTDLGYTVVESSPDEVLMERRMGIPFCYNLGLVVVTGLLWLAYWIPRIRHPRFDTRRLTRAADGSVAVERVVVRR
ncbi:MULTISPECIES: hypothetical protein [unclassified Frondihabitans]|uniref:hypothetical protein n=1 Tax=unclassified Frondihabitans TaxID=2626248 RepID=UPI000F4DE839|nr:MULTISPECIES: hypothetical protein [unclassified Frondihabitans]RPE76021.1 hypothetical protein EDF37_1839 [Frondihabitans sp. PhB153]RPF05702.1 hypothetical protein EDF39_2409 [Frondihabitans sp. PhB161]